MNAEAQPEYTLDLIVIRGKLLRIFAQAKGNGVGLDEPEMNHLLEGDEMPSTYLILDSINTEENSASYSLAGFVEQNVSIKGHQACTLTTNSGEKILIGFNNLRKPKAY